MTGTTRPGVREKTLCVQGIPILLRRKHQKNLYLYVRPEGVLVTAPAGMAEADILSFLEGRAGGIRARREALAASPLHRPVSGGSGQVLLWGENVPGPFLSASAPERREEQLSQWYRAQLRQAAEPLIERWAAQLGLEVPWWSVRSMRTRWGTCNPQRRRIWLNLRLVHYPPQCLEYVVVHELCHLLEPGHNAVFWAHVARCLPDWGERRKLLNEFTGPSIE